MKQHLFKGRGAPTQVPLNYSQLYLDLDTGAHWWSIGIDSVNDWIGPIVTEEVLNNVLDAFAAGQTSQGAGSVEQAPVVNEAYRGRHVSIKPINRDARLFILTDDTSLTEEFDVYVEPASTLDMGTTLVVYNNTLANFVFKAGPDVFKFAGEPERTPTLYPGAVLNVKLIGATLNTRYWLVWGDAEPDSKTVDGFTPEEIQELAVDEVYDTFIGIFDNLMQEY